MNAFIYCCLFSLASGAYVQEEFDLGDGDTLIMRSEDYNPDGEDG